MGEIQLVVFVSCLVDRDPVKAWVQTHWWLLYVAMYVVAFMLFSALHCLKNESTFCLL